MGDGKRTLERRDVTAVSVEPCSKSACFYAFSSPCSPLLAQNFDVFHDEKTALFRHTRGGRVPIGCWHEDAPSGTTGHTSQRKRKKGGHRERESPPISRSHCDDGSSFRRTLISICSTKRSSHTRHSSRAITPTCWINPHSTAATLRVNGSDRKRRRTR